MFVHFLFQVTLDPKDICQVYILKFLIFHRNFKGIEIFFHFDYLLHVNLLLNMDLFLSFYKRIYIRFNLSYKLIFLNFLVMILRKHLITRFSSLFFSLKDMQHRQMCLFKLFLRLLERQFLLFPNIGHEFLKIIFLIVLGNFLENHFLYFDIIVNPQKSWNLFIVDIHQIVHFQGGELEHAFLSNVGSVDICRWQLGSCPRWTQLRILYLKISFVSKLAFALLPLLGF